MLFLCLGEYSVDPVDNITDLKSINTKTACFLIETYNRKDKYFLL